MGIRLHSPLASTVSLAEALIFRLTLSAWSDLTLHDICRKTLARALPTRYWTPTLYMAESERQSVEHELLITNEPTSPHFSPLTTTSLGRSTHSSPVSENTKSMKWHYQSLHTEITTKATPPYTPGNKYIIPYINLYTHNISHYHPPVFVLFTIPWLIYQLRKALLSRFGRSHYLALSNS